MSNAAEVIKATPNPSFFGSVIVSVSCPLCGSVHTHGVPKGDVPEPDGDYGGRVAHCAKPEEGSRGHYTVSDPHGLVKRARRLIASRM